MKIKSLIFLLPVLLFPAGCEIAEGPDTEKPVISLDFAEAFPRNCDTLFFGESFSLQVEFSDNAELGAFSLDIHHNFDRHTHSTETSDCEHEPIKVPVNPFLYIGDFSIPDSLKVYRTRLTIPIPAGNENGPFDEGDYHFFISLTDKEGWSAPMGISIQMRHRD